MLYMLYILSHLCRVVSWTSTSSQELCNSVNRTATNFCTRCRASWEVLHLALDVRIFAFLVSPALHSLRMSAASPAFTAEAVGRPKGKSGEKSRDQSLREVDFLLHSPESQDSKWRFRFCSLRKVSLPPSTGETCSSYACTKLSLESKHKTTLKNQPFTSKLRLGRTWSN